MRSIIQRRIVAELDALQAEMDALKRLQAETPVNKNTGQAAAELDALLPAILQSSLCFAATGDRAFKGKL